MRTRRITSKRQTTSFDRGHVPPVDTPQVEVAEAVCARNAPPGIDASEEVVANWRVIAGRSRTDKGKTSASRPLEELLSMFAEPRVEPLVRMERTTTGLGKRHVHGHRQDTTCLAEVLAPKRNVDLDSSRARGETEIAHRRREDISLIRTARAVRRNAIMGLTRMQQERHRAEALLADILRDDEGKQRRVSAQPTLIRDARGR